MSEPAPTPRTDEAAGYPDDSGCWKSRPVTGWTVEVDFARTLEREIAALEQEIVELEAEREHWRVRSVCRDLRAQLDSALERERVLLQERARLDWLLDRMFGTVLPANRCVAWKIEWYDYGNAFPSRAAIDAAMSATTPKEGQS